MNNLNNKKPNNRLAITFASVTFANKAKALLIKEGYEAQVIRTPGNIAGGCGYSVIVNAPVKKAAEILEQNNIHYRSITDRGGEALKK